MTILVDPRTPNERSDHGRLSGDVLDFLTRIHKVPAISEQLDAGDVAFTGNGPDGLPVLVGVELKKVGDVLQCIQDGRFAGVQLPGLAATYRFRWLIVEGPHKKGKFDGLVHIPREGSWVQARPATNYGGFEGWLLTMNIFGGMRVWFTYDRAATCRLIARLYSWWQEPWESHTSHLAMHSDGCGVDDETQTIEFTRASVAEMWAKALPGVGGKRARAAAKAFGSPLALALATVKEWAAVKGIGKETAEKVVKAITGG